MIKDFNIKSLKDIEKNDFRKLCEEITNELNNYYKTTKWSIEITGVGDIEPIIGINFKDMNKYITIQGSTTSCIKLRGTQKLRNFFSTWNKTNDILCKENEEFMICFYSYHLNDEWTSEEKQICRSSFSKYEFECIDNSNIITNENYRNAYEHIIT
jgi:hypothetical protein